MGKVERLSRQILNLELKIEEIEYELDDLRDRLKEREVTKAEYYHMKKELIDKRRAIRTSIKRKNQARNN